MDGIHFIFKATLCVFVCLKTDFPLKIIHSINEEQFPCRSHSATSWLGVELWLPARHLLTRTCLSTPLLGSSYNVFGVFGVFYQPGLVCWQLMPETFPKSMHLKYDVETIIFLGRRLDTVLLEVFFIFFLAHLEIRCL